MTADISSQPSLVRLWGPGALSGHRFAAFCNMLLLSEFSARGQTTTSDRSGDYRGADALMTIAAPQRLDGMRGQIGFQFKFVPSSSARLSNDHKKQIRDSLKSAVKDGALDGWILITPEDFDRLSRHGLSHCTRRSNSHLRSSIGVKRDSIY